MGQAPDGQTVNRILITACKTEPEEIFCSVTMLYSAGYSGHSRQQIVPTSLRLRVNSAHSRSGDTRSSNDFIPGISLLGSVPWPRTYLQSWLRVFETKPRLCGGSWTRLTSNNNPFTINGTLPEQPMANEKHGESTNERRTRSRQLLLISMTCASLTAACAQQIFVKYPTPYFGK